jgi:hypothetical protein
MHYSVWKYENCVKVTRNFNRLGKLFSSTPPPPPPPPHWQQWKFTRKMSVQYVGHNGKKSDKFPSTDRKLFKNIIVKSWKLSTSIRVGESHFTKFSFYGTFSSVKMGLNNRKLSCVEIEDLPTHLKQLYIIYIFMMTHIGLSI